MNKKKLTRLSSILLFIAFIGGVLLFNEILFPLNFFLTASSFIGIVFIERYLNSLPPEPEETRNWEKIKAQGKQKYLLKSLKIGLASAIGLFAFDAARNYFSDKSLFEGFGTLLMVALVVVFVPLLGAHEIWKLNEKRFNESQTIKGE